ncbi:hypothetical protein B0T14DRAFT_560233 [Immersiella caudata]|uniref:Uncharacterized protein n=1 Tax=Immersiella caudata TaxID=314043 RepID=A0AA39XEM3_9PEZI|nr:hypothetical protein B0T14DRAFT_560233 [Immersiella caudata]
MGESVTGINGANGGPRERFTLKQEPVENLRPLRVVVVGAGFSGIAAAIRIPERLRNVDLTVYEKNDGVGGVWWLNKYPGVACDIPSHSYQYSFAPNPNWSSLYAPGSEIQKYLEDVAERFGATRFIKTRHEVEHCVWDGVRKLWKIKVQNLTTGETIDDEANVLLTARGQLNEISWPSIPGLETFSGKKMHSGAWDTSYDFRNKKVAIIGNGSSAIQIIPSLQKVEGTSLTCFMRSPTWISGAFGDQGMVQLGLDPKNTAFTPEQHRAFASDPASFLAFRKVFEDGGNLIHDSTLRGTEMQSSIQSLFRDAMSTTLSTRPDLIDLIIPTFPPGCRRLTPGPGFLESLLQPNVTVIPNRITSVSGSTIATTPSSPNQPTPETTHSDFDVLICATGFTTSSPPPFPVLGRKSLPLSTRWDPLPSSYLSLAVDSFPNLLLLFGPNSAIGFGSLTKILEAEVDYAVKVIRKLQKEDYDSMEPKRERVDDFGEYVKEYFKGTVYTDECRSWYKRGEDVVGLWPGSTLHALEALRSPRWEDWEYERAEKGNALRWLGDGWSVTQTDGDASWYINPEEVEMPWGEVPEENPRFKARPWSY